MTLRPMIMLNADAHDAVRLWQRAFPELEVDPIAIDRTERVTHATLTLGGVAFVLFESPTPHGFGPTPAHSMIVDVERPDDVDAAAEILSEGGEIRMPVDAYDFARRYAWVTDRYGVNWQLMFEGS